MSDLTEVDIFDCLKTNLKLAAEYCVTIANRPLAGPTYEKLREALKLVEGACRQAAHWREDSRWLQIGLKMEEAHRLSGNWLRGKHPRFMFMSLAEALVHFYNFAEHMRTAKTGRVGTILPVSAMASPPRNVSQAGWTPLASGLVVPEGARAH